jgi:hypothetical protein
MTLDDLLAMRQRRQRPAMPVHLTDCGAVFEWCEAAQLPTIFVHDLASPGDCRALHGLDVVVVGGNGVPDLSAVREARPAWMLATGYFAWRRLWN